MNQAFKILYGALLSVISAYGEHYLSFTVPCYNCAQTLRDSLDSIYQQNLTIPFEVVCTDDGSTDATLAILRVYEARYPNFHVIRHEQNHGGGAANNTCVAHSEGDLLFRLDSDNVLVPGSIAAMVDFLDATGSDGVAFQEMRFFERDHEGRKSSKWSCVLKEEFYDIRNAFNGQANPFSSGNYLYTRASFDRAGGYPTERSGTDTHCFGIKQYLTGSKIAVLPGSFYWHYYNANGYYCREEKTGNNRRVLWALLKKFRDVFTQETQVYLDHVNVQQQDPFVAMGEGKIVARPI